MTRRATLRQSDIERAIKAAMKLGGFEPGRVRITVRPDGSVELGPPPLGGAPQLADDPWEEFVRS